jgi:hypothetical protein
MAVSEEGVIPVFPLVVMASPVDVNYL